MGLLRFMTKFPTLQLLLLSLLGEPPMLEKASAKPLARAIRMCFCERSVWIFTPTACFYRPKTGCRRNMHPNYTKFKSMPVSHFIWLPNFWLVITSRLFVQAQPHLFHCFYLRVGQVRHLHCPLLRWWRILETFFHSDGPDGWKQSWYNQPGWNLKWFLRCFDDPFSSFFFFLSFVVGSGATPNNSCYKPTFDL